MSNIASTLKKQQIPVRLALFLLIFVVAACTPERISIPQDIGSMRLSGDNLITGDGVYLPLKKWNPKANPKAIILALHGFNDYSDAFSKPAAYWAENGFLVYAYDQRGFGATSSAGRWPGKNILVQDLLAAADFFARTHPDIPLYLLGESMGGAVLIAASQHLPKDIVSGLILAAPAVWAKKTMPPLYSATLWAAAHVTPWLLLSGRGLQIQASDNHQMLVELSRDPLIIKQTRVDAIYGLVNLMDDALESAPSLTTPTLLLYGTNDEVIPKHATAKLLAGINNSPTVVVYPSGYHMLLRDLEAHLVLKDIAEWIRNPDIVLPSGHGNLWKTFF
jgi:acylglycerol lipase